MSYLLRSFADGEWESAYKERIKIMKWKVTYVKENENKQKEYTEEIEAPTYTRAYTDFLFDHPKSYAITDLVQISK